MNNNNQMLLTEFDVATTNQEIQMLKAFIPFVDINLQRTLALCIRLFELINTLDFYNHIGENCPLNRKSKDKKAIFEEIKKYCPKENMEMFEIMSNMDNISEYLKMYQAMSTPSKENTQSDVLKNFLTPEQQKMYETYKDMLNI